MSEAEALLARGRPKRAWLVLNRVRELDPCARDLLELEALAHFEDGRFDLAEPTARKALCESPESARAHLVLGWTLLGRRKAREARDAMREALRLDPHLEEARLGMLEALSAQNVVYALLLAPQLWAQRRTGFKRTAVLWLLIGGPIVLFLASEQLPLLRYVAYAGFVVLGLLVLGPILVGKTLAVRIRIHPSQRHYMKPDERIQLDSGLMLFVGAFGGGFLSDWAVLPAQLWVLAWSCLPLIFHASAWPPGKYRTRARIVAIALPLVVAVVLQLSQSQELHAGMLRLLAMLLFGYWAWRAPKWAREDMQL